VDHRGNANNNDPWIRLRDHVNEVDGGGAAELYDGTPYLMTTANVLGPALLDAAHASSILTCFFFLPSWSPTIASSSKLVLGKLHVIPNPIPPPRENQHPRDRTLLTSECRHVVISALPPRPQIPSKGYREYLGRREEKKCLPSSPPCRSPLLLPPFIYLQPPSSPRLPPHRCEALL
jgi:hypothetical protein